ADTSVIVYLALDNWGTFWVDGQMIDRVGGLTPVGAVGTWARTYTFQLSLSAGPHVIGITLYNQGALEPGTPSRSEAGPRLGRMPPRPDGRAGPPVLLQAGAGWRAIEEKQAR